MTTNKSLTPKFLDSQNPVRIDEWLDVESEKCKNLDPDISLTRKFMRYGMEDGYLFTDADGRIWGVKKKSGKYYPFHFNFGSKVYGYRISKVAVN